MSRYARRRDDRTARSGDAPRAAALPHRIALDDCEVGGARVERDQIVGVMIGAANRDERVFDQPDVFDVLRDTSQHLAFGKGTHFCLGASLARLETRVALEAVQARLPDFEIDAAKIVRVHSPNVRGFASMPMEFTPRS